MTSKLLTDILTRYSAGKRDGNTVRFEKNSELTVYASLGNEVLTLERVVEITVEADVVIVNTQRNERFILVYEDVRCIRYRARGEGRAGLV